MKILSIDCGIKNLALCFIDIKSEEKFKILYWNNINLFPLDPNLVKLKCSDCKNRNASFYVKNKEEYIGYCNPHKPEKCKEIKECNTKTLSYKDISLAIIETFNNLKFDYDKVYIEQQPKKNGRMKCLQMMMFHNFMVQCPTKEVKFISPKYKLKDSDELYKTSTKKTKYLKNKDISVQKTIEILKDNKNNIEWYEKLMNLKKKKDDYSDCFMQAYNYFNRV